MSVGWPFYHFALRVPRNRLAMARDWLARHAELLPDEDSGETTFHFDNWNAEACYAQGMELSRRWIGSPSWATAREC